MTALNIVSTPLWVRRFVYTANAAIQIYDTLLTLEQEERFIWKSRITASKIFYLLNRYLPCAVAFFMVYASLIASASETTFCSRGEKAAAYLRATQFLCAQAILALRAFAVWEHRRSIGYTLLSVFVATTGFIYYSAFDFSKSVEARDAGLLSPGCVVKGTNSLVQNLIALLLSETLQITLLVTKSIIHYRYVRMLNPRYFGASIIRTMLKDGIAYYACTVSLTVSNLIVNVLAEVPLRPVFVVLQLTVQNILCVRLVLHVRRELRVDTWTRTEDNQLQSAFTTFMFNDS